MVRDIPSIRSSCTSLTHSYTTKKQHRYQPIKSMCELVLMTPRADLLQLRIHPPYPQSLISGPGDQLVVLGACTGNTDTASPKRRENSHKPPLCFSTSPRRVSPSFCGRHWNSSTTSSCPTKAWTGLLRSSVLHSKRLFSLLS